VRDVPDDQAFTTAQLRSAIEPVLASPRPRQRTTPRYRQHPAGAAGGLDVTLICPLRHGKWLERPGDGAAGGGLAQGGGSGIGGARGADLIV